MTTRQRVRRTRAALVVATALSAVLWAGLTGLAFLVTIGGFDAWVGVSRELRFLAVPAAVVAAGVVTVIVMVRNRGIWSERHVALWVERQQPTLAYRLVTVLDPAVSIAPALETQVRDVRWTKPAL